MSNEVSKKPEVLEAREPAATVVAAKVAAPTSLLDKAAQRIAYKREKRKEKKKLKLVPSELAEVAEEEKVKIVSLFNRLEEENNRWQQKRKKAPWFLISALVCIGLPTLLASIYFFFIAADRYVAETRFAIRSNEPSKMDALGALTGMPAGSSLADSYIVTDFIRSRDMVRLLDGQVGLRGIFSSDRADFISRLNPAVSLEGLLGYWNKRMDVQYDPLKTTIVLEVQAFTPEEATRIANAVLDASRDLVNRISANARRDAARFASQELARAEIRLRNVRQEILDFRMAHNDLDPLLSAEATLRIASTLEAERAQLATQLASLSGYLGDEAPTLQMLRSRMAALESEIERIQGGVSGGDALAPSSGEDGAIDNAMASTVGRYQELQTSQLLAEKGYASALTSLERARAEAERTQSYLAVYLPPTPTDAAAFPMRGRNVLIVLIFSAIFWAVGQLTLAAIRDHTS